MYVQFCQAVGLTQCVGNTVLCLAKQRDVILDEGDPEQGEVAVDELEAKRLGDELVLVHGLRGVVLCVGATGYELCPLAACACVQGGGCVNLPMSFRAFATLPYSKLRTWIWTALISAAMMEPEP